MSLSSGALEALTEHWAIAAVGRDELARIDNLVHERLARRAVGRQISFSFSELPEDEPVLGAAGARVRARRDRRS